MRATDVDASWTDPFRHQPARRLQVSVEQHLDVHYIQQSKDHTIANYILQHLR